MKKSLTKTEHWALTGLLEIAWQNARRMEEAEKAAAEILDEDNLLEIGHFSDAIWEPATTISQVLKNMGVALNPKK